MDSTQPKPFVFVLMPFAEEFDDVYELGIKPACEKAGAYCERVDKQIFESSILARVYNEIDKADIIVADMTGKNPNVFYEVGYAHALGKRVILLTQSAKDIPFDLKDFPHVVYSGRIAYLKKELRRRVAWHLAHLGDELTSRDSHRSLEYYLNRQLIENESVIDAEPLYSLQEMIGHGGRVEIELIFGRRNPTNRILSPTARTALVFPPTFEFSAWPSSYRRVLMADGRSMIIQDAMAQELLPLIEETEEFRLRTYDDRLQRYPFDFPFELRFYTPFGIEQTDSSIRLRPKE